MNSPSKHLVGRLVEFLANVPAGHLERADTAHQRNIWPMREARPETPMPEALDLEGVVADQMTFGNIADHDGNDIGPKGRAVVLAVANHSSVGDQLDEDEVSTAELARAIANNECLEFLNVYQSAPVVSDWSNRITLRTAWPLLTESMASLVSSMGYVRVMSSSSSNNLPLWYFDMSSGMSVSMVEVPIFDPRIDWFSAVMVTGSMVAVTPLAGRPTITTVLFGASSVGLVRSAVGPQQSPAHSHPSPRR